MARHAQAQVSVLVQYVVLRGDLVEKWPLGALVAQACHASTAALHLYREDPATQAYLEKLDSMHKVVLRVRHRLQAEVLYDVCIYTKCLIFVYIYIYKS